MTGSSLAMPQSASHGRPYGVMPLRCSCCALAPPTWSAAWGRCAAWRHSLAGGPCLQSRQAVSTSVTTASSAVQAQGHLPIHCFAICMCLTVHPCIHHPSTCWFVCPSLHPSIESISSLVHMLAHSHSSTCSFIQHDTISAGLDVHLLS